MGAEHFAQGFVQEVCGRVVARCGATRLFVDGSYERAIQVSGELMGEVHPDTVLALGIEDFHHFAVGCGEGAAVAYLAAHLGVEWSS